MDYSGARREGRAFSLGREPQVCCRLSGSKHADRVCAWRKGSGCRAATTPPRAAAEQFAWNGTVYRMPLRRRTRRQSSERDEFYHVEWIRENARCSICRRDAGSASTPLSLAVYEPIAHSSAAVDMRKYWHVINIGIQNTLVYRVNFLFRAVFALVPLAAVLFLWRAIYEGKERGGAVAGYTLAQMTSYYLLVTIVDALTAVNEDDWQIA